MKIVLILFVLIGFSCSISKDKRKVVEKEEYPQKVKDLKLEKLYDKTKWTLYCIHCDEFCHFSKESGIKDSVTFGSLPLKLDSIDIYSDTADFYFFFYYQDTLQCNTQLLNNAIIDNGAGYLVGSDSIIYYIRFSPGNKHIEWGNPKSRYQKLLQPEVINYIKKNRATLHTWFRAEAIKRGILEPE